MLRNLQKKKLFPSAVCLVTVFEGLSFIHLSWPAVSHICRLVFSPSTSMLFIWKSIPDQKRKKGCSSPKGRAVCGTWVGDAAHPAYSGCLPWTRSASTSSGSWTSPRLPLRPKPGGTSERVSLCHLFLFPESAQKRKMITSSNTHSLHSRFSYTHQEAT